jgi:hypothetical protein
MASLSKTARVVAQVDHDAVEVFEPADLFDHLLQPVAQVGIGLIVEGGDAKDRGVAFEPRANGRQADAVADDRDVEGFVRAFAHNGDDDFRAHGPAHQVDRLFQRQTQQRLTVHMGDEIARLDAGLHRRGVVHRRDDAHEAVFLRHLDAEAAELAAGLNLHRVEIARRQVAGMRVERGQHAVDRRLDQRAFVDLFDVVGADALEHVAEQVELLVDGGVARLFLRKERPGHLRAEDNAASKPPDCRHDQLVHMLRSFVRPASVRAPRFVSRTRTSLSGPPCARPV